MESRRGRRVVRLVPVAGEGEISIELHPGINRIGRQRVDNHIVLISPEVSRFHAEIELKPAEIVVRDLGSANGTFVNGARVTRDTLKPGDLVGFSDQFTLRLVVEQEKAPPDTMTLPRSLGTGDHAGFPDPAELGPESIPPGLARRSEQLRVRTQEYGERGERGGESTRSLPRIDGGAPAKRVRSQELDAIERELHQLATLFQVSKKCMSALSLAELDRLFIDVLERSVSFQRAFVTYQLPSGDWKLVLTPKGVSFDREEVRSLLQRSVSLSGPLLVGDSRADPRLGTPPAGHDCRLLLPLRTQAAPLGLIFIVGDTPEALKPRTVEYLELFAEIAAMAVAHRTRDDRC